tara:strand:- start:912 stop:1316 length:405 start_codon:yes stop_codon:yes gene_type:complete
MAKLSRLRSDSKKETEGVWVEWEHGVSLLIARLNNPGFQSRVRVLTAKHTKAIRSGSFPDGDMEEVSKSAMAHHVLLGWKNIEDEDGGELAYSAEKALEFLTDPDLRDMYQFVLTQANERDLYRREVEEDSAGN